MELLRQLRLIDDPAQTLLSSYARPAVRNYRGTEVGRVEALFVLPRGLL